MDSKKNVYLIQPNSRTGDTISLPYAVGVVAAYSLQVPTIRENFVFPTFLYKKEPLDTAMKNIKDPSVVGFSNYMWNCDYNVALAEKIKHRFPECIIVFGGHHVPDNTEYLDRHPFLDILVHGEGEEVFARILCALVDNADFSLIPNISFREKNGNILKTEKKTLSLRENPSPYSDGLFDTLLAEKEDGVQVDAVIETNRGCPHHCAYCCWVAPKIRMLPEEKVYREIAWLSNNRIGYCFCADANFGMFSRDESFADAVIAARQTTGSRKSSKSHAPRGSRTLSFASIKAQRCGTE
jgi:putative methyltransferase